MKIVQKILLVLAGILFVTITMVYDAYYIAPSKFTVRYEKLASSLIPKQMDNVTILFFSDLNFGTFMDEERLNKLILKINDLSPDIVVFGGDVFTDEIAEITTQQVSIVSDAMHRINAPLGKFAVFGDQDHISEQRNIDVQSVFWNGDFEILENNFVQIHNTSSQGITLVGLDEPIHSSYNITAAYENVPRHSYTILITHTPDTAGKVPEDLTNYAIAGHSLGGQIFYGFGASYAPIGATDFFRGKHKIGNHFTLDITNGVGTKKHDVRFLSNSEIVLYRLKHISEAEDTIQNSNES